MIGRIVEPIKGAWPSGNIHSGEAALHARNKSAIPPLYSGVAVKVAILRPNLEVNCSKGRIPTAPLCVCGINFGTPVVPEE
jgi:hypothetical protein